MFQLGFKRKFKNIDFLKDEEINIFFKLDYKDNGALKIQHVKNDYFDVDDFQLKIDEIFDGFNKEIFDEYDIGIQLLSVFKYLVDNIPNVYAISHESNGITDYYLKKDIIKDYNKIKKRRKKYESRKRN